MKVRSATLIALLFLIAPVAAEAHAEIFFPKIFSLAELTNTGFVLLNVDPTIATVNVYLCPLRALF